MMLNIAGIYTDMVGLDDQPAYLQATCVDWSTRAIFSDFIIVVVPLPQ